MSTVQALFQLAQGLAMTALAWFTGNPKYAKAAGAHYASAVAFGMITGVATVAGRFAAGDEFKRETSGGFGSSTSTATGGGNRDSSGSGCRIYSLIFLSDLHLLISKLTLPDRLVLQNHSLVNCFQKLSSKIPFNFNAVALRKNGKSIARF